MGETAEFIVVAESVWHSTEGKTYLKGQTIKLPANTKTNSESSVQPLKVDDEQKRRGRPPKAE